MRDNAGPIAVPSPHVGRDRVGVDEQPGVDDQTGGAMIHIGLHHYLVVSAALFSFGILAVLTRRNAVNVLMGVELILNSANLNLVAFSRFGAGNLQGQMFAVFVIVIAAAEVAVALAIILTLYRLRRTPNLDEADLLKG
jgi:NADH:ubiquinone oxidoreductase subunit K